MKDAFTEPIITLEYELDSIKNRLKILSPPITKTKEYRDLEKLVKKYEMGIQVLNEYPYLK
jgi:hypothetical protein